MTVRLPAMLADYACGRTGMCCNMAWKVPVSHADRVTVENRLQQLDAEPMLARWRAALVDRRGHQLLRQPDGRCTMLAFDAADLPTCKLQGVVGLDHLPSACRNFPRSVVRTPTGIEVAFTLGCPTAAGMVARRAAPFTWVERPSAGWPYAPLDRCPDRVAWTRLADVDFAELCAAREAWWAAIAASADRVDGVIEALLEAPGEPAERPAGRRSLAVTFGEQDIKAATLMLTHRRGPRGDRNRAAKRALWRGLTGDLGDEAVRRTLERVSPQAAGALAVHVQHAGVHVRRPATETLLLAARRVLAAVAIAGVLLEATETTVEEAMADGLTAGSRLTGAGNWYRVEGAA